MNKKILCTICARGGSKGVVNKNIRLINNKPLIAYTIEIAQKSKLFCGIAVSSDSEDILNISLEHGANWSIKRPDELASDTAGKLAAIRHCVQSTEKIIGSNIDIVCDLDATSPLRNLEDIQSALAQFIDSDADNLITATPSRRSPYFNLITKHNDNMWAPVVKLSKPLVRRQDAQQTYDMNASIYLWKRDVLFNNDSVFLKNTELYVMPEERSWDIDSEFDFMIVSMLLKERNNS